MKFSSRLSAALLAGALSLSLSAAFAQQGGRGGAGVPPALLNRLNLTADQKSKVDAATAALRADMEKAQALTDAKEKRMASRKAQETYQASIKAALTEDQQKQLQGMMAEAREYSDLGPGGAMLVGLDLTAEQKTKVKEIGAKYKPDVEKLRASMKDATDKAAVRAQMNDLNKKIMDEVKTVLTPEQQQKLAAAAPRGKKKQ